ncbi:hypothetical protein GWI33_016562 [Rhynchophorus ferrugineus]|uniref:Reverse transcriptase domain-containing protein n=1 Tax=Rhynchophorus ferrugineus TaxID=354439 RepID=A0A834I0W2_RHYFE|nr:hypothetical protein GWI33_016562 [Rhynchophorus ferrugineus]
MEDSTMTSETSHISQVSFKLPEFWKTEPETWFYRVDTQFGAAGITTDATKFDYPIASLNHDVLSEQPEFKKAMKYQQSRPYRNKYKGAYNPNFNLFPANGSKIATYGTIKFSLEFVLGRTFDWVFLIVDVMDPILGVDILYHYEIQRQEIKKLEREGIIRQSSSSWSSPVHMVKKKDGSWRICGEYRTLNANSKPDRYPILHTQDFSSNLHNKCVFTTIDLEKAYHQIPMNSEDIEKTAITTPVGLHEYIRMPFRLRNAAQILQRLLDKLLQD